MNAGRARWAVYALLLVVVPAGLLIGSVFISNQDELRQISWMLIILLYPLLIAMLLVHILRPLYENPFSEVLRVYPGWSKLSLRIIAQVSLIMLGITAMSMLITGLAGLITITVALALLVITIYLMALSVLSIAVLRNGNIALFLISIYHLYAYLYAEVQPAFPAYLTYSPPTLFVSARTYVPYLIGSMGVFLLAFIIWKKQFGKA